MVADQFSLRDSAGAGRADKQAYESNALRMDATRQNMGIQSRQQDLAERQYSAQEQMANTQRLLSGVRTVKQNPNALPHIATDLAEAGIIRRESLSQLLQNAQSDPQGFMETLADLESKLMIDVGETPPTQLETLEGPDGSLLQRDPTTNALKQIQGRDQGIDRLMMQDQMARQRDEENRRYQDRVRTETVERTEAKEAAKPTAAQSAVDKEFAKEYTKYKTGGFADAQKGIVQLRKVQEQLEQGKELTGPVTGRVPDVVLSVFNPTALAAREDVEEVVQRNLRLILGAQFTEKEGERLIARAYNPALSEDVNAQRVNRLLNQMELALQAKEDAAKHYESNGTIQGWTGTTPTVDDFYQAMEVGGGNKDQGTAPDGTVITNAQGQKLIKQNGQWVQQ
jgi:hypothetical protein